MMVERFFLARNALVQVLTACYVHDYPGSSW